MRESVTKTPEFQNHVDRSIKRSGSTVLKLWYSGWLTQHRQKGVMRGTRLDILRRKAYAWTNFSIANTLRHVREGRKCICCTNKVAHLFCSCLLRVVVVKCHVILKHPLLYCTTKTALLSLCTHYNVT